MLNYLRYDISKIKQFILFPILQTYKYKIVFTLLFFSSNPRSKVKGTLELYHAYISDSLSSTIESDENDTQNDSGGWELLDQPTPTSNHTPEEQTEVII